MHGCIAADRIANENIVCAAEHDSIDLHGMVYGKMAVKDVVKRIVIKNALLNALDKAGAWHIDDAGRIRHTRLQIKISPKPRCCTRCHHKNLSGAGLHAGWLDGGFYAHNGDLQLAADPLDASSRCRVAGDQDCLDPVVGEQVGTAHCERSDFGFGPVTVRCILVVAIIYELFMWQGAERFTQHACAAEPGIEYADRAIIHG